jgi:hypothetical protein
MIWYNAPYGFGIRQIWGCLASSDTGSMKRDRGKYTVDMGLNVQRMD